MNGSGGDERTVRRRRPRLPARRRVQGLVGGVHPSRRAGRSLDYDDLRPYRPGDDVRDVDWKASARAGEVVLRRHVAEHRQRVVLVVDTGLDMTARAAGGRNKADLVAEVVATFAAMAADSADPVGLVAGHDDTPVRRPLRAGRRQGAHLLQVVSGELAASGGRTDLPALLAAATLGRRRRHLLVVVTDEAPLTPALAEQVRRLRSRHDLMWVTILDADLLDARWADRDLRDVSGTERLVAALRTDDRMRAEYQAAVGEARRERRRLLARLDVPAAEVGPGDSALDAIARMVAPTRARGGRGVRRVGRA